jgi:hypothetical protein
MYQDHHANKKKLLALIEEISEIISDSEACEFDMAVRTITNMLEYIEQEAIIKEFYEYVPPILSAILSAFTNDDITSHGREQLLHIFYLCLRTISWADGIDNNLIDFCLNETFN